MTQKRTAKREGRDILAFIVVLLAVLSVYQISDGRATLSTGSSRYMNSIQAGGSADGTHAPSLPANPGLTPESPNFGLGGIIPFSNQSPPGYDGAKYYAGSQYAPGGSNTATSVEVTLVTPEDHAVSGDFYYVILSIFDNAASYDQIGFASNNGSWEWAWSWTPPCIAGSVYHYDDSAFNLAFGTQYAMEMQAYSNGSVEFLLYLEYVQSGDLEATHWADTGGTKFVAATSYTCDGDVWWDYTDYEEVDTLSDQTVPNWPFLFEDNIFDGLYQNSWTANTFGTNVPGVIQWVINKSNTTVANEGWMGPEYWVLEAGRPGVDNFFPIDVSNLACSGAACDPIGITTITGPSGWTISYSPSYGTPNFWFNASVTIPTGVSGDFTFEVKATDGSVDSAWYGYYTTFLVTVAVSSCTRHC